MAHAGKHPPRQIATLEACRGRRSRRRRDYRSQRQACSQAGTGPTRRFHARDDKRPCRKYSRFSRTHVSRRKSMAKGAPFAGCDGIQAVVRAARSGHRPPRVETARRSSGPSSLQRARFMRWLSSTTPERSPWLFVGGTCASGNEENRDRRFRRALRGDSVSPTLSTPRRRRAPNRSRRSATSRCLKEVDCLLAAARNEAGPTFRTWAIGGEHVFPAQASAVRATDGWSPARFPVPVAEPRRARRRTASPSWYSGPPRQQRRTTGSCPPVFRGLPRQHRSVRCAPPDATGRPRPARTTGFPVEE